MLCVARVEKKGGEFLRGGESFGRIRNQNFNLVAVLGKFQVGYAGCGSWRKLSKGETIRTLRFFLLPLLKHYIG